MSAINTGSINNSFPLAGVNNSSQGFRSNFSAIKSNLDIAGAEISDLQNKVVVKSALISGPLNNDMANTLISNALTLGFRGTTHNLGNNLNGTVVIDVTNGDAQYGVMTGDVSLEFAKWAPTNTQSSVQVIFTISDPNAGYVITFPANVDDGTLTLENYSGSGIGGNITVPNGVNRLHFNFTTINCGLNIEVQPLDRPRVGAIGSGPAGITNQVQFNNGGNFDASSDFVFDDTNKNLTLGADLIPKTTEVYDLGSSTYSWKDLYLSGTTLYLGNAVIKSNIDGSLDLSANPGVMFPTGTPTSVGSPGDVAGMMKVDSSYIYICTGSYNGTTPIWKRTELSSY